MFQAIESKAFELYARLRGKLEQLSEERGVVSAEFIAVTAVAVLIAITVIYTVFSDALTSAINTIGTELNDWINSEFEEVG